MEGRAMACTEPLPGRRDGGIGTEAPLAETMAEPLSFANTDPPDED